MTASAKRRMRDRHGVCALNSRLAASQKIWIVAAMGEVAVDARS
jgi:hypothetical protein